MKILIILQVLIVRKKYGYFFRPISYSLEFVRGSLLSSFERSKTHIYASINKS